MFEAFRRQREPTREFVSLGIFHTLRGARQAIADDYQERFGPIEGTEKPERFRINRINFDYQIIELLDGGEIARHPPLKEKR